MYLFAFDVPNWALLLIVIFILLYKWSITNHDCFSKLNVAHDKPFPMFGTFKDLYLQTDSHFGILLKQYQKYKHKSFFGIYEYRKPVLVVTDPGLIRQITAIHADHFDSPGEMFTTNSILELAVTIFGEIKCKSLRRMLSPVFSSENLRFMFYLIEECSVRAVESIRNENVFSSENPVNVFNFFARFFTDVMASTTFGMKPNSFFGKDNVLFDKILSTIEVRHMMYVVHLFYGSIPGLLKFVRIPIFSTEFHSYFNSLIKEIMEYRRKNNIEHFDVIQILTKEKLQKDSESSDSASQSNSKGTSEESFTEDDIITQCLLIVLIGLIKSSVTASCALVELAANPDIQEKLLNEIEQVMGASNHKGISYAALDEMEYLTMVIFETLRKWPTDHFIDRMCTKGYTLYDKSNEHLINLQPGQTVCIPTGAIQRDPNHFPNPEKFYPERFSEEKRGFIRPYTFLPFGAAVGNCIGMKIAILQIKAALVTFLSEFQVESVDDQPTDVPYCEKGFFLKPKNDANIRLRQRSRR